MQPSVKIISFYTRNTPYEQEAKTLLNSCEAFNLDLDIEGLPSLGKWNRNICMKPVFILKKLLLYRQPLFWVDADAVFLQPPDFSLFQNCDLSVRKMEIFSEDPRYALNTASMFINFTLAGLRFVVSWCQKCQQHLDTKEDLDFIDQISCLHTLQDFELNFFPMPVAYCKIFDLDSFFIDDHDVIIEQTQASRRLKKLI